MDWHFLSWLRFVVVERVLGPTSIHGHPLGAIEDFVPKDLRGTCSQASVGLEDLVDGCPTMLQVMAETLEGPVP